MTGGGESELNARIREIFLQALEYPSGENREEFLQKACEGEPQLREEVESLLAAYDESELVMERDFLLDMVGAFESPVDQMIGRYQVIEKIGEGGFGEVFRVEQKEPIRRELALKIIKPGMDSREIIQRFEGERQALARLDHRNVAHIIDAGATESGRPYFVMELALGMPIIKYCDQHNLTIKERLELFKQVCDGVQHAHQKGILHRDLNPSNILVVEQDDKPVPKIIDFGIAKSLQGHLTGKTILTQRQILVGTPDYMSPEQFTHTSSQLDARTDIYSLGAVLYELVSGFAPFTGKSLNESGISRIHRIVQEKDPPKPSTRLRTIEDTKEIAQHRGTTVSFLDKQLRGDLDRIIMKCLEKERNRRYQSVDILSQDLTAFLESRPVTATSPSPVYRFRKLVKRHKQAVFGWTAGCAVVIALLAVWFALQSGNTSNRVMEESDKSLAVLRFNNLSGDPQMEYFTAGITDGLFTKLSQISSLNMKAQYSAMMLKDEGLELKEYAEVLGVDTVLIGSAIYDEGRVRISTQLVDIETNQELWSESFDRDLEDILALQSEIALNVAKKMALAMSPEEERRLIVTREVNRESYEAFTRGRYNVNEETDEGFKKGLDYFNEAVEKDPADPLAWAGLAYGHVTILHSPIDCLGASWQTAKAAARRALDLDRDLPEAWSVMGDVKFYFEGDYAGAEKAFLRANELDPNTGINHFHYAWFLAVMGRLEEAISEHLLTEELEPLVDAVVAQTGALYFYNGDFDRALAKTEDALRMNPESFSGLIFNGWALLRKNRIDEAIAVHKKLVEVHPPSCWVLGVTYALTGHTDKVSDIIVELEQLSSGPFKGWAQLGLSILHIALGNKDEAVYWLRQEPNHAWRVGVLYDIYTRALLKDHPGYIAIMKEKPLPEYAKSYDYSLWYYFPDQRNHTGPFKP